MVQYVSTKRTSWPGPPLATIHPRDFWKIKRRNDLTKSDLKDFLREQNLPYFENALKPVLIEQHIRWQRGLLDYEKCSAPELRKFAKQRGISIKLEVRTPPRKSDLVAKLEEADDGEMFSRFLDLPAELRVRIYELHFHSFETDRRALSILMGSGALPAPFPVPLTMVNSQLRLETLPVYYSTCTFDFDANYISGVLNQPRRYAKHKLLHKSMQSFLLKGPAQQVAMLRKLKIHGRSKRPGTQHTNTILDMCINTMVDLGTDHKLATVGQNLANMDWDIREEVKLRREESMEMLREVVSGIDRRDGGKKLLVSDMKAICEIFVPNPRKERKDNKVRKQRRSASGEQR